MWNSAPEINMGEAAAIDVKGMTKRFGSHTAVDHIDLQVASGEICGFLGPNGSGKTTFIRMLCGLLRPDAGSGTCLGHDVIKESELIKLQVGCKLVHLLAILIARHAGLLKVLY